MIYSFDFDDTVAKTKIAEHKCQAVLMADRCNDPNHRDPNPDWYLDRIEIEAQGSGKWVAVPKYHRLYPLLLNQLQREKAKVEEQWLAFLREEEREPEAV